MCARRCTRLVISLECQNVPSFLIDQFMMRFPRPGPESTSRNVMVNRISTNDSFDRKAIALSRACSAQRVRDAGWQQGCTRGGAGWVYRGGVIPVHPPSGIARAQPIGYSGPRHPYSGPQAPIFRSPGTHIQGPISISRVPYPYPGSHMTDFRVPYD